MHKIEFNYHDSIVRVVITGHFTIMEIEQLSGELQNNVTDKKFVAPDRCKRRDL